MFFDAIYILTCKRVDNQISYNQLPDNLKKRVVMVVQAWERSQYDYDCEYLVLPESIHVDNPRAIALTREYVYDYAKNQRYCTLDDDLVFKRRNAKYWTGESNMDRSSRICTPDDIQEMFELYSSWLDDDVAFCSCGQSNNPPGSSPYQNNASMTSGYWIDGPKIKDVIETEDFTPNDITCGEDVLFILTLLSNGKRNRVSQEFVLDNRSYNTKSLKSDLWDTLEQEKVTKSHLALQAKFPEIYKLMYDPNSTKRGGGFRDYGKTKIQWSKAYKLWEEKQKANLGEFFE